MIIKIKEKNGENLGGQKGDRWEQDTSEELQVV